LTSYGSPSGGKEEKEDEKEEERRIAREKQRKAGKGERRVRRSQSIAFCKKEKATKRKIRAREEDQKWGQR